MGIVITPAGVASAVRDLAAEGSIVDLTEIISVIEEITSTRTLAVLKAQAALEALKPKGRRFLIACSWKGGEKVSHGMEYPAFSRDGREPLAPRVLVDDRGAPFYSHYDSMEELKVALKHHEVTYHIEYLD